MYVYHVLCHLVYTEFLCTFFMLYYQRIIKQLFQYVNIVLQGIYQPVINPCVTIRTEILVANEEANSPAVAIIAPVIPTFLTPNRTISQIQAIASNILLSL